MRIPCVCDMKIRLTFCCILDYLRTPQAQNPRSLPPATIDDAPHCVLANTTCLCHHDFTPRAQSNKFIFSVIEVGPRVPFPTAKVQQGEHTWTHSSVLPQSRSPQSSPSLPPSRCRRSFSVPLSR